MIEELISQIEKEFETTQETDVATQETTEQATMDNVDETETQKPVSIVQSLVAELEKELMTESGQDVSDESSEQSVSDEPADESEPTEDKPTEQGGKQDEDKPAETEDETEPTESGQDVSDEQADEPKDDDETDEPSDQLTALMNELQTKSKALDKERTELLERVEQAEKRASESERQMKRLVLSHALANRDDIVDGRLIAELVDVESMDVEEGKTIEEAVTERINNVVKKYGNVLAKEKGEKYVARNVNGMTTYEKVKPIGRATAKAQDEPFSSKQQLLEEARQRAEKGGQKERVAYLALKRKYGLK